MTDNDNPYRITYNAHERAEAAALEAIHKSLSSEPIEALTCLADPTWRWETRSWMSETIIDQANELANERLDLLIMGTTP